MMCGYCENVYSNSTNLYKHQIKFHRKRDKPELSGDEFSKYNFKCFEENCSKSFKDRYILIEHLALHNIDIQTENLGFTSKEEFNKWKVAIEIEENVTFLKNKEYMRKNGVKKVYYVCSRSITRGNTTAPTKRATKRQGSSKLNHSCVSSMVVTYGDPHVEVERIATHYGHEIQVEHVRLHKHYRDLIAEKLAVGMPEEEILESIRNNMGPDMKRIHMVTKQDIRNIKKQYNLEINEVMDAFNVDMYVNDCLENPAANNVLFYKRRGDVVPKFRENDFCLILMNTYQQDMLKAFGSNIVCIDSTHDLRGYSFELYTILVVDNDGDGFPVAFMFSNRTDTEVLELFFATIKSKVGLINCRTFMSDVTTDFSSTWGKLMVKAENQIYTSWHVKRAWDEQLRKIQDSEKKNWVGRSLNGLRESVNFKSELDFKAQLDMTIGVLLSDPDTKPCGNYFRKHFSQNYKKWARIYHKDFGIESSVSLESLHDTIRYFSCLTKKKILGRSLHSVLQYTRGKTVERVLKCTKGKCARLQTEINQRHRTASTAGFRVVGIDENKWKVRANEKLYHVEEVSANCCSIMCDVCTICIHAYQCTCVEFYTRGGICEHIHFVCSRNLGERTLSRDRTDSEVPDIDDPREEEMQMDDEDVAKKRKIQEVLSAIQATLDEDRDFETLNVSRIVSYLNLAGDELKLAKMKYRNPQGTRRNSESE